VIARQAQLSPNSIKLRLLMLIDVDALLEDLEVFGIRHL
jgi:hypothetical protein